MKLCAGYSTCHIFQRPLALGRNQVVFPLCDTEAGAHFLTASSVLCLATIDYGDSGRCFGRVIQCTPLPSMLLDDGAVVRMIKSSPSQCISVCHLPVACILSAETAAQGLDRSSKPLSLVGIVREFSDARPS